MRPKSRFPNITAPNRKVLENIWHSAIVLLFSTLIRGRTARSVGFTRAPLPLHLHSLKWDSQWLFTGQRHSACRLLAPRSPATSGGLLPWQLWEKRPILEETATNSILTPCHLPKQQNKRARGALISFAVFDNAAQHEKTSFFPPPEIRRARTSRLMFSRWEWQKN